MPAGNRFSDPGYQKRALTGMDLQEYRKQIDVIDDEIVRLFRRRMEIVDEMGRLKRSKGVEPEDRNREAEIVGRLSETVSDDLKPAVARLYNPIFSIGKERMKRSE